MPTVYPPLSIGAARRLAIFKREAASPRWVGPLTWRNVRFARLTSHSGLGQGFNGTGCAAVPVWYCHDGEQFRNERDACQIVRLGHTGWYTDVDEGETAIGIVAGLSHGRFIAGYRLTMNDERVYFSELFDNEREAAHMADEHARIIGERESEYAARDRAAQKLDSSIEEKRRDVITCKHALEFAIAASKGAAGTASNSATWGRAMLARREARAQAHGAIEQIRELTRERESMGEF